MDMMYMHKRLVAHTAMSSNIDTRDAQPLYSSVVVKTKSMFMIKQVAHEKKCLFDLKECEVCASHLCAEKVNSTLSALQHFLRGMRKYNEYMLREGSVHSPHRLALSHRLTAQCLFDLQIHARCATVK